MSFLWGINTTIYYCTIPSYSINIPFIECHRWLNMYIYICTWLHMITIYIYCITLTFWDPNHFSCFTRKRYSCCPPFRSHGISWGVGQRCNACTWVVWKTKGSQNSSERFKWLGQKKIERRYRFVWNWVIWFQFSMASTDAFGMV